MSSENMKRELYTVKQMYNPKIVFPYHWVMLTIILDKNDWAVWQESPVPERDWVSIPNW